MRLYAVDGRTTTNDVAASPLRPRSEVAFSVTGFVGLLAADNSNRTGDTGVVRPNWLLSPERENEIVDLSGNIRKQSMMRLTPLTDARTRTP